ncbi:MAG: hypothetical protein ACTTH8_07060 [Treponema sp.]
MFSRHDISVFSRHDISVFSRYDIVLPAEVKKAATESLPAFLETEEPSELKVHALAIAKAFYAAGTFNELFGDTEDSIKQKQLALINSFEKNVGLLVEKTWVDQSNEEFKGDILYRLKYFCQTMRHIEVQTDFCVKLPECVAVLRDVVMLLFGRQTDTEEFFEYAFRIDPDFGLFWFYIECFRDIKPQVPEKARLAIFLGMYFLANF